MHEWKLPKFEIGPREKGYQEGYVDGFRAGEAKGLANERRAWRLMILRQRKFGSDVRDPNWYIKFSEVEDWLASRKRKVQS